VDCFLPYFRQHLITRPLLALLPFQSLFPESSHGDQLLDPPVFSGALRAPCPCPPSVCSFQLLVYYCFFCVCGFIPGVAGGIPHDTWFSPVGLLNISQAGLESVSGSMGALLFSQCNGVCRRFVWAGGSECQNFDSSWWFFPSNCGSSVSAKFLIYRVHADFFCPLVTILDPITPTVFIPTKKWVYFK
jgi:hypothetical protein